MKIGAGFLRTFRQFSRNTNFKSRCMLGGVGLFSGSAIIYSSCQPLPENGTDAPKFLSMKEWQEMKLVEAFSLTHNVKILRFALPTPEHVAGISIASCVSVGFKNKEGKITGKPYTPISTIDQTGTVDFAIKKYPDGVVSGHMHALKPGDSILIKGPWKKYPYEVNAKRAIGMIAGGTGITPMLQVARKILENPEDNTNVSLIFCNVSEDDIMLRDTLDALQFRHPNFKVHYVVDKASPGWTGGTGYVNLDMVKQYLPAPNTNSVIFVCGPGAMVKHISGPKVRVNNSWTQGKVDGLLKEAGYTEEEVYKF